MTLHADAYWLDILIERKDTFGKYKVYSRNKLGWMNYRYTQYCILYEGQSYLIKKFTMGMSMQRLPVDNIVNNK